jgi:hypothetical protein
LLIDFAVIFAGIFIDAARFRPCTHPPALVCAALACRALGR